MRVREFYSFVVKKCAKLRYISVVMFVAVIITYVLWGCCCCCLASGSHNASVCGLLRDYAPSRKKRTVIDPLLIGINSLVYNLFRFLYNLLYNSKYIYNYVMLWLLLVWRCMFDYEGFLFVC